MDKRIIRSESAFTQRVIRAELNENRGLGQFGSGHSRHARWYKRMSSKIQRRISKALCSVY